MSDIHIWIYGGLALLVALFLFLTFRPLQSSLFDRDFAISAGFRSPSGADPILAPLLSLIVGIRSVGVVLMSGMVIAPAVAARQYTDRLQTRFSSRRFFRGDERTDRELLIRLMGQFAYGANDCFGRAAFFAVFSAFRS